MKRLLFFIFLFLSSSAAFATHNRSGEITFEQISLYTYRIKIVTYTKTSSPADRDSLKISWGDNTTAMLPRTVEILLPNDVKHNEYIGIHTYPGPTDYKISFEDPNRDAGVLNIPGSVGIPFYVETLLRIDPFKGGFNNSPVLLQPPIDRGAVGIKFVHNPSAYDPDGDSLSYDTIPCKGQNGVDIPGWTRPQASTSYTINKRTGDLVWNAPQKIGEYNVAIKITEWRKNKYGTYSQIGYVIRDMQIEIEPAQNKPPVIDPLRDTCVEAGSTIKFTVRATDPDITQTITLSSTGGPYITPVSPATFTGTLNAQQVVTGTFEWKTDCAHVRRQEYQLVFKAEDNDTHPLTDLKSMSIRVVAPAPKNVQATVVAGKVVLTWDPEICTQAIGYEIYRKTDSTAFTPAPCETGLPAYAGFVLIDTTKGISHITYTDSNKGIGLTHGLTYCYRIVARFPEGVQSYTSLQVCAELKKDVPVMSLASVSQTDSANGAVDVRWSKPDPIALDTIQNKAPYTFKLYRKGTTLPIASFTRPTFSTLNDTVFTDSPSNSQNTATLNTQTQQQVYYVEFYTDGSVYKGSARAASTIFLSIKPTDNKLILSWTEDVPWTNISYNIYRKNNTSGIYQKIGTSTTRQYTDSGLANKIDYCYYVEGMGSLTGKGLPKNIINKSQVACAAAVDNIPPCPPKLSLSSCCRPDCDPFANTLTWDNPDQRCPNDVIRFYIYYKKSTKDNWPAQPIDSLDMGYQSYTHANLTSSRAGCYAIASVDSAHNVGEKGNVQCVDNCPQYTLPNTFTPNHDGVNDNFRPFKDYRFVQSVTIKIFNRWGQMVFSSENGSPDINWDGTQQSDGRECTEGAYYYVCEIHEIHLDENVSRTITGFIELIRGKEKSNTTN